MTEYFENNPLSVERPESKFGCMRQGRAEKPVVFHDELRFPNEGMVILDFDFTDENRLQVSGCIFDIQVYGRSHFVEILKDVEIHEVPSNEGTLIKWDDQGKISIYKISEKIGKYCSLTFVHKKGDRYVWFAGKNGLKVINLTRPPYNPTIERDIEAEIPDGVKFLEMLRIEQKAGNVDIIDVESEFKKS
jgi:hypothetical protein